MTERIRLHELAAGRSSVSVPVSEIVRGTGIEFAAGTVAGIDLAGKTVHTEDGRSFPYDKLVYALGSRTDTSVPGVAEYAYTVEKARELNERLQATASGTVAVVGGGLTGIEMAAELAETFPSWSVKLVTGAVLGSGLSEKGRNHVRKVLARLGVEVISHTRVLSVDEQQVRTDAGVISADAVMWTASFAVPELAESAGLAVDNRGKALVDATLRSVSHPDVYVVGDAATVDVPGIGRLREGCATAGPIGAAGADAVNAHIRGEEAREFGFRYLVQCVSLGRHDGLIQPVRADDEPKNWTITGKRAAWIKEKIAASTVSVLYKERDKPGTLKWLRQPKKVRAAAMERAVA
jgi:NADH dehydrogenase FAD-containing subunit